MAPHLEFLLNLPQLVKWIFDRGKYVNETSESSEMKKETEIELQVPTSEI